MRHSSNPDSELLQLLGVVVDSRLSESERARLEELLSGNPDRMRVYLHFLRTHVALEEESAIAAVESMGIQEGDILPALSGRLPRLAKKETKNESTISLSFGKRSWTSLVSRSLLAATLLVCAFGLYSFFRSGFLDRGDSSGVLAATVAETFNAEWGSSGPTLESGDLLHEGARFTLEKGLVQLAMRDGSALLVESPAEVEAVNGSRLRLLSGKLYGHIPRQSAGFIVTTPLANVVDLGTKFGLEVRSGNGDTTAVVFEGAVQLWGTDTTPDSKKVDILANHCATATTSVGLSNTALPIDDSSPQFVRLIPNVGYVASVLRKLPVLYHTFDSHHNRRFQSTVRVAPFLSEGIMQGDVSSQPVGPPIKRRSRPKQSIAFSGTDGAVEVSNGLKELAVTEAYTFVLWVRVDSQRDQNILLGTNNRGPLWNFGPQLRVLENGTLEHYCYCPPTASSERDEGWQYLQQSASSLRVGKWYHVAASASSNGDMSLYINGEEVASKVAVEHAIVTHYPRLMIGCASGENQEPEHHMESLDGAIDELAIFDRCLTVGEIRDIYRSASR